GVALVAARDVHVEQMNLVVVRDERAVRPVDERALSGALAAVTDWNRAADDREPVAPRLRCEEALPRPVAEGFRGGDTLGIGRPHERKILRQHGELGARL